MMVLNRTDSKRRRKDDSDVLQGSPKRTKVHAQRKFAQGSSNLSSPALTSPVKDKVKVNGTASPSDVLPIKRPNTEDFLTFLCFRGTKILPARLDFFSNASVPEPQNNDISGASTSNPGPSRSNTKSQEKSNASEKVTSDNTSNAKPKSHQPSTQGRALKLLKKKYHEQRLAKQKKVSLTKLAQKVKGRHIVHQTRYGTRSASLQPVKKTQKPRGRKPLLATAKLTKKPVKSGKSRVPKYKQLRVGLRSGGQLPPGSDVGLKRPTRRPRVKQQLLKISAAGATKGNISESTSNIQMSSVQSTKVAGNTNNPNKSSLSSNAAIDAANKQIASSLSDFSSDDDQPLVKKSKKTFTSKINKETKLRTTKNKQTFIMSSGASVGRPSRKTKEAATLYMEMLKKDLRSPDEYDDDALSVESFPELPNSKKTELREKELKALAENHGKESNRYSKNKKFRKEKLSKLELKNRKIGAMQEIQDQKSDDRSKRILLRNKTKNKILKAKEKAKKIISQKLKKTAANVISKNKLDIRSRNKIIVISKTQVDKDLCTEKKCETTVKPKQCETRKSSLSVSPQRNKIAQQSAENVSERVKKRQIDLKAKGILDDEFSDSDEEPLKVLTDKFTKKDKSKKLVNEEESTRVIKKVNVKNIKKASNVKLNTLSVSPERKNVKRTFASISPERKLNERKVEKQKSPQRKVVENIKKESKKVVNKPVIGKVVKETGEVRESKKEGVGSKNKKNVNDKKDIASKNKKQVKLEKKKKVNTNITKSSKVDFKSDIVETSKKPVKQETEDKTLLKENKFKELAENIVEKDVISDNKKPPEDSEKKDSLLVGETLLKHNSKESAKDIVEKDTISDKKKPPGDHDKKDALLVTENSLKENPKEIPKDNVKKDLVTVSEISLTENSKKNLKDNVQKDSIGVSEKLVKENISKDVITDIKEDAKDVIKKESKFSQEPGGSNFEICDKKLVNDVENKDKLKKLVHLMESDIKIGINEEKEHKVNLLENTSVSFVKDDKEVERSEKNKTRMESSTIPEKSSPIKTDTSGSCSNVNRTMVKLNVDLSTENKCQKDTISEKVDNQDIHDKFQNKQCTSGKLDKEKVILDIIDKKQEPIESYLINKEKNKPKSVKCLSDLNVKDILSEKVEFTKVKTNVPVGNMLTVIKSNSVVISKPPSELAKKQNISEASESSSTCAKNDPVSNKISVRTMALNVGSESLNIVDNKSIYDCSIGSNENITKEKAEVKTSGEMTKMSVIDVKVSDKEKEKLFDLKSADYKCLNKPQKFSTDINLNNKQNVDSPVSTESKQILKIPEFKKEIKNCDVSHVTSKSDIKKSTIADKKVSESVVKNPASFQGLLQANPLGNKTIFEAVPSDVKSQSFPESNESKVVKHDSTFSVTIGASTVKVEEISPLLIESKIIGDVKPKSISEKSKNVSTTDLMKVDCINNEELTTVGKGGIKVSPLIDKTSVEEKVETINKSDNTKSNILLNKVSSSDSSINNAVKKSKQSVNDTWRLAFKNAKIPKPGQCSPVMMSSVTDEKPFVRKPFTSHTLKKQINFDESASCSSKTDSSKFLSSKTIPNKKLDNLNIIIPFKRTFQSSSSTTIVSSSVDNITTSKPSPPVIDPETLRLKEAEVEDIVRKYVGGKLEKLHSDAKIKSAGFSSPLSCSVDNQSVNSITSQTSLTTDQIKSTVVTVSTTKLIDKLQVPNFDSSISVNENTKVKQIITFTSKKSDDLPALGLLENKSLSPVISDKSIIADRNISPQQNVSCSLKNDTKSPFVSASPPASPSSGKCETNIPVGGKHLHLLPVEQTLKKLSQTTKVNINRKSNINVSINTNKQSQTLQQQSQATSGVPDALQTSPVTTKCLNFKEKDGSVSNKSESVHSCSDIDELNVSTNTTSKKEGHLNLLSKRKVNMSADDINKWLNDSTSAGIEHMKNCGIFEKNQCECKPYLCNTETGDQSEQQSTGSNDKKIQENKTSTKEEVSSTNSENVKQDCNINDKIDKNVNCNISDKIDKNVNCNISDKIDKNVNCNISDKIDKNFNSKSKDFDFLNTSNKSHCEKKVNVTQPVLNRTVSSEETAGKLDSIPQLNKSTAIPDVNNKTSGIVSVSKNLSGDNLTPPVANISRLKISRSTNKTGESETENSSRDPSEVSSPPPRDDVSSADESPEKSSFVYPERRSIFHQRRSAFSNRTKPSISRSPSAFSPENESSVYAFEPDLPPASTPFRRNKIKESRSITTSEENRSICTTEENRSVGTTEDEGGPTSSSIAVQVNLDNEAVLECSTQTETDYDENEGHLFYIPFQPSASESCSGNQFQGVAVKLGTEGPDQRVIMRAKLVTKPPSTFSSSTPRPLQSTRDMKVNTTRPEQKVKPLTVNSTTTRPPVGTVQPTTRSQNPPENPTPSQPTSQQSQTTFKRIPTPDKTRKPSVSPPETPKKDSSVMTTLSEKCKKEEVVLKKTNKDSVSNADCSNPVEKPKKDVPVISFERGKKSSTVASKSVSTSEITLKDNVPTPSTSAKSKRTKSKGNANDHKGSANEANIKLKEAPSFYPTEKEFLDPLEYIEKIRPKAEKFGLCRIIPPTNFKPECKVSDDMRFTAYNQYVHKMMHRWGPNVKEMLAIKKYLATQSIALTHPPWIGGMEVDLPRLYQTVQQCGGLKEVIEKKRWQRVADAMRIPKSAQDRVTKLDDIYCKFLLPYDTLSHGERTKLFEDVEKEWEKRMSSTSSSSETDSTDSSDYSDLDECIVKGRNMALNQFYRIARNTMSMYFRSSDQPSADEVESEYWNHVGTRQSHVCVHSGSIDSGACGYGFPTAKNSSTSKHPWNLKVLTNNTGSILRSLGPLMGVTVPTLHVGMLFSACCWYRDPHGLPWIEYLHTGASKIWYGIPDESSTSFREAVMDLVPNFCRDKTIWLASDTAMIPPQMLVSRGVSLCRTVQEPGQFILVFSKAFTSSICTGYLVSESVYFAQPTWLSSAHQIFKDISESCEPSMFSLERLLFSIAGDARSHVDVLLQVLPMVKNINENEIKQRDALEKLGLKNSERLPLNKRKKGRLAHDDDGDYECEVCRANLFLSLVTNTHEEGVYCLNDAIELLTSKPSQLEYCKLLYTYSMEELEELIEKMKTRIETKSQKKSYSKSLLAIAAAAPSAAVHVSTATTTSSNNSSSTATQVTAGNSSKS